MTALLELKQKIKNLYGQYEVYLLPIIKFVVALVYFVWINANMGYMKQLDSVFIVLILALICSILPSGVTVFVGFLLMLGHAYALGMETAAFMLILILFLAVLFLRFSAGQNIVLVCTPLSFGFGVPVLLPIGSGLLGNAFAAFPAGSGVILYYFIRFIRAQSAALQNPDVEIFDKLKILTDGLMQNWAMWITLVAFVMVIILVNIIRTRAFDYAWRIAIVAGGVCYVLVMLGGSLFVEVTVSMVTLIVQTVLSLVAGIILEFFVFGGDYSRTERLEYEDDEYYYYVKAVPKASVSTSERSIKRITAQPAKEEKKAEVDVASYANPIFHSEEKKKKAEVEKMVSPVSRTEVDEVDFEKKLEESLKDL